MRLLLDTHAFLWFVDGSPRLPIPIRGLIEDPANHACVCISSFWEIGIKAGLGKLPLTTSLLGLEAIAASQSIEVLPITVLAIDHVQHLPYHHKDPFDRILVATAITTGSILLSADPIFDSYGVSRQRAALQGRSRH